MVGSKSEYGWYIVDSRLGCCTYYLYSMLVSIIYDLCVVKSTNLVMRMMEQPEHGLAYAFETFTIM